MNSKNSFQLYLLTINFIFAYFRLYKVFLLKLKVDDLLGSTYLRLLIYVLTALMSIVIVFPQLLTDIKKMRLSDFNDIMSYLVVASLGGYVINAVFMNAAGSGSAELAGGKELIVDVLIAVIFAPLFEEITLRIAFSNIIKDFLGESKSAAVYNMLINATLFSTLHLVNQNDLEIRKLVCYFLIYGILGFTNAYAYAVKGNIWFPICIHSMWNGFMYIGNLIGYIITRLM